MQDIPQLIQRAQQTTHGFKDLQLAAEEVVADNTKADSVKIANTLLSEESYQPRCIAVLIYGTYAATDKRIFKKLKDKVSRDESWQVQEILAKAFDQYCSDTGYEVSLPIIHEWLNDPHQNVRRAVSEGLRIWTGRPYFRDHPQVAAELLSGLHNDPSEHVRKSIGNSLRDISKKHPDIISNILKSWDTDDKAVKQTYKLACKFIEKNNQKKG